MRDCRVIVSAIHVSLHGSKLKGLSVGFQVNSVEFFGFPLFCDSTKTKKIKNIEQKENSEVANYDNQTKIDRRYAI